MVKNTSKNAKVQKRLQPSKSLSRLKLKSQSKSTKSKIEKLNANINEIDDIRSSFGQIKSIRQVKALDAKSLKDDLVKDTELKEKNKKAEKDLALQLDLITSMGL